MQMVTLTVSNPKSAYGILKKGRINGALLYGPPGTGKTHLARVLARESKAVMIHASVAELESKWVGETEKLIKGVFNLGRMVSPSIIFIDEADALFRARGCNDRGYERTRMSQLLSETDGLKRAANPPFLLLATNFPSQLDNAVLRRVPGRLHIGMPSTPARKNIFNICLAEETLDHDVDLQLLASRTHRYTGSDIRTTCIQTALICEDELLEAGKIDQKRVLKMAHFEKAMGRSGPTVSRSAMQDIMAFATEFDPAAVPKIRAAIGQTALSRCI